MEPFHISNQTGKSTWKIGEGARKEAAEMDVAVSG